jgi:hypothetical protein
MSRLRVQRIDEINEFFLKCLRLKSGVHLIPIFTFFNSIPYKIKR